MLRRGAALLLPTSLRTWQGTVYLKACQAGSSSSSSSSSASISSSAPASSNSQEEEQIGITFIDKDGKKNFVQASLGKNMLEVANDNEIELEGACEGSLACSTCHVIVQDTEYYKKIPAPSDDELDMLDMAFGLTDMSRLGCQVLATKEIDGITLAIPNPAAAKKKQ